MITIGLDVGGTKVLGIAVDAARPGRIVASRRVPTPDGGAGVIECLAEVVTELSTEVGAPRAVGVGVPGLVDRSGTLHMGPHLRHIADLPLVARLSEAIGVPVAADNDANCHALAELRAGAAVGASEVLVITLGTGIGGGVITSGAVLHGANGFAGEPGHMVVDPNGPPCACGKRGCWERFASGTGLGRLARDAAESGSLDAAVALAGGNVDAVRGEHVTAAARDGDGQALQLLDDFAWWISLGLANLANILDPSIIVIGGGLSEAAELLLPPVRRHFEALVMAGEQRPPTLIVAALLGEDAGAIGAAALATDLLTAV